MRKNNIMLVPAWLFVMASVSIDTVVQSLMLGGPGWKLGRGNKRLGRTPAQWYKEAASQSVQAENWRNYWDEVLQELNSRSSGNAIAGPSL